MNPFIQFKNPILLFLVSLVFACLAFSSAHAVSPPPDGGYPGDNTAEGDGALQNLTAGIINTAIGKSALQSNTVGSFNTAIGAEALINNTTGDDNTATGEEALLRNTTGASNTATGVEALLSNTTGSDNTAIGAEALINNTTGDDNTATGWLALRDNTTGHDNTANGLSALLQNTTGINNTAIGAEALRSSTTGFNNVAIGAKALFDDTTGSTNIALGPGAGQNLTTGDRNIDIGNDGVAGEEATIRIGTAGEQTRTFIAGIFGTAVPGTSVFVGVDGKLGTRVSSARFKDEIKPMGKASEAILALKPVTFRYKRELDAKGIPQFGLVAEDVEKVNPDLVARDAEGKIYTVRYEAVNAMLLNEFLKEHKKVGEQQATIEQLKSSAARQEAINAQQQKGMEALAATVKEQAALIQKVSAQLELSKAAPQTVVNNQ